MWRRAEAGRTSRASTQARSGWDSVTQINNGREDSGRENIYFERHPNKEKTTRANFLEQKAGDGRVEEYSKDNKACRVHKVDSWQFIESRNVTFMESPQSTLATQPQGLLNDRGEGATDQVGVIDESYRTTSSAMFPY